MVFSPVGLEQDAVDLFQIHDAGLVADGFQQRAEAEVAGATQEAFAATDDEREGVGAEGVVAEAAAIELVENELFDQGFAEDAQGVVVKWPFTIRVFP